MKLVVKGHLFDSFHISASKSLKVEANTNFLFISK
jgi:hypothetical protein